MINDVIDINDKKTYPGELIKLFDISNLTIDLEKARKILSKYAFSCAHVFSTYDINSYKNNGIQRPLIVNNANSKDYLINPIIKEYVLKLNPELSSEYDEMILKDYIENINHPCVDGYYGKHAHVFFTLDNMDIIRNQETNDGYRAITKYDSGEIHELSKKGISYAIIFMLYYDELISSGINIENIIKYMYEIYRNIKSTVFSEGHFNGDILPDRFINVERVKELDNNE